METVNTEDKKESIETMVERLVRLGTCTDKETLKSLLERRQEARPLLIEKLNDESTWDVKGETAVWGPVAIVHLLSAMGESKEAAVAVTDSLIVHYGELGDWPTEDAPDALSGFGKSGLEPLSRMVLDQDLYEFCRSVAATSLFLASKEIGGELIDKSIAVIKKAIEEEKENKLARTVLTSDLAHFKDPGSLNFIKSLFDMGLLDENDFTFSEVKDVYAGQYDDLKHMRRGNPLHIFSNNFYRKSERTPCNDEGNRKE